MRRPLEPRDWGLGTDAGGRLMIGAESAAGLARAFGTPLHVLHEERLEATAARFRRSMEAAYPGRTSVHFAFKCNSVPAVIEAVRRAGLKAEVMSPLELELALRLGYRGEDVVVNGPGKTAAFLKTAVESAVRLIAVDSPGELALLNEIARAAGRRVDVLLRVNPDLVPRGMNAGSATGSRKGCAFGFDLKGGEVRRGLGSVRSMPGLRFRGFHFHVGTGIRDTKAHARVLDRLAPLFRETRAAGFGVDIVDVGGGFASPTAREMTSRELLVYQGLERLPAGVSAGDCGSFEDFSGEIAGALLRIFNGSELPELISEPGRSIAGPNQLLLLTVSHVKTRPKVRKWLITDGGLGTVTLPTFYECHEVLLADDDRRPRTERVTIVGPVCFASDIVYRNIRMPEVRAGETIAVMDSGAYFIAQESSFGFPRPAVVAVNRDGGRLVRRRETFADMTGRDLFSAPKAIEEVDHVIRPDQERLEPGT
jgi:diaminopimelate decarboxylase